MTLADDLEKSAALIAREIPALDRFVARCKTYFTATVTIEVLVYWLLQFRDPTTIEHVIRLLNHVNFLDSGKLTYLILKAFDRVPAEERSGVRICSLGKSFDSGAVIGYEFGKSVGWGETELAQRWFALETVPEPNDPGCFAFIDDNITSGTQLIELFSEFLEDHQGKREHLEAPLSAEALARLRSRRIYVLVAVELAGGGERVVEFARTKGFQVTVLSGLRDVTAWLEYGCPAWDSKADAEETRRRFAEIGFALLDDLKWDDEKRRDRSLGYGNLQRLSLFPHNVPKSLLTAFWKFGSFGGRAWIPLFPERREWLRYEAAIREMEPELQLVARLVCSGTFGKAAPALEAGLNLDGTPRPNAKIAIGGPALVVKLATAIERKFRPAQAMPVPSGHHDNRLGGMSMDLGPSRSQVETFNSAALKHNAKLGEFKASAGAFSTRALRMAPIPIRIYNNGSAHASEVVLRLELPDGVEFVDAVPPLPSPPDPPRRPQGLLEGIKPLAQTQIGILHDIRSSLSLNREDAQQFSQSVIDRGTRIVNIFFGKVLHGTFRDRELRFLSFPGPGSFLLNYTVICEEARRPVPGIFTIEILAAATGLGPDFVDAWFSDEDDDE